MWNYYSFDGVRLPRANADVELGTPQLASAAVATVGGLVDVVGSGVRTMTAVHAWEVRGIYAGDLAGEPVDATLLVESSTDLQVESDTILDVEFAAWTVEMEYMALAAKLGYRGSVVIEDPITGATRSKTARLMRVGRRQRQQHGSLMIEVSILFESLQQEWA